MTLTGIKKGTLKRLHGFCTKGERHNRLINRLLDECENKNVIDLNEDTLKKLFSFADSDDIDEALNRLMDTFQKKEKKKD